MEKKQYVFNERFKPKGLTADQVGKALDGIKKKAGALTAKAVVHEASDQNHPLHCAFEWDDTIAAEKFREKQARDIITCVDVIYENVPDSKPAFVHITEGAAPRYEEFEIVVQSPSMWTSAVGELTRSLSGIQKTLCALNACIPKKAGVSTRKNVRTIQNHINIAAKKAVHLAETSK